MKSLYESFIQLRNKKSFHSYSITDVCLPNLLLNPKSGKKDVNIFYLSSPRETENLSCVEYLFCTMCQKEVLLSTESVAEYKMGQGTGGDKRSTVHMGNRDQSS